VVFTGNKMAVKLAKVYAGSKEVAFFEGMGSADVLRGRWVK